MSAFPTSHPVPPTGLFWFVARDRNLSHFVRCITTGAPGSGRRPEAVEMAAWQLVQLVCPHLRAYAFDFFPRGMVRRCERRGLWIVELDPKLARGPFIAHLVLSWPLNPTQIAVVANRSYASAARVGSPVADGLSNER